MNPTQECFDYCCLAPRRKLYTPHPDDCSLCSPCSVIIIYTSGFLWFSFSSSLFPAPQDVKPLQSCFSPHPPMVPKTLMVQAFRTSGALEFKQSDQDSGNVLNVEQISLLCSVQPPFPLIHQPSIYHFYHLSLLLTICPVIIRFQQKPGQHFKLCLLCRC